MTSIPHLCKRIKTDATTAHSSSAASIRENEDPFAIQISSAPQYEFTIAYSLSFASPIFMISKQRAATGTTSPASWRMPSIEELQSDALLSDSATAHAAFMPYVRMPNKQDEKFMPNRDTFSFICAL